MKMRHDLAKLDELRFANRGIVDPPILCLEVSIESADALFAALEIHSQNALPAKSIALPDFPHRRACGEGVKLRCCAHTPSRRGADKCEQSTPGTDAAAFDADWNPIGLQRQSETINQRAEPRSEEHTSELQSLRH